MRYVQAGGGLVNDRGKVACVCSFSAGLLLISALACDGTDRAQAEQVATIEGVALVRADLIVEAGRRSGPQRALFERSAEARKKTLERLIRHRLLVAEARRCGVDKEPRLRRRIEEMLVTALLRKVERETDKAKGDGEIEPRKVRQLAVSHPGSGSLKSGDTGFLSPTSGGALEEVRKLAAALPRVGAVAKPARVGDVWAVVVKTGRLPAIRLDDKVLRRLAERRLQRGQGRRAGEQLAADLRAKADVQIDDAALAAGDWRLDEGEQTSSKGTTKR